MMVFSVHCITGQHLYFYMANVSAVRTLRFCQNIMEVRIYYCPESYSSRGVREFIKQYLPIIRERNVGFPVSVVPCRNIDPWMLSLYTFFRQKKRVLANMTVHQVLCCFEEAANNTFMPGCRGSIKTRPFRGLQLLPTELKRRDPFKVLSKLQ